MEYEIYNSGKLFPRRIPYLYEIDGLSLIAILLNQQTILVVCSLTGVILGRFTRKKTRERFKKWLNRIRNEIKNSSPKDILKYLFELSIKGFDFSLSFVGSNILWLSVFALSSSVLSPFLSAFIAQFWIVILIIASRLVQIKQIKNLLRQREIEYKNLSNEDINQLDWDRITNNYQVEIEYQKKDIKPYFKEIGLLTAGFYIYAVAVPFIFNYFDISKCQYCIFATSIFFISIGFGHKFENQSVIVTNSLVRFLTIVLLGYIRFFLGIGLYNHPYFQRLYNNSYLDSVTKMGRFSRLRKLKHWYLDRICLSLENLIYPNVVFGEFEEAGNSTPVSEPTSISESSKKSKARRFWSRLVNKVSPDINKEIQQMSATLPYSTSQTLDIISEINSSSNSNSSHTVYSEVQSNKTGFNL